MMLKHQMPANLGGIGFGIAHEITHAFDAAGSEYDEHGTLNNWWTDADRAAFIEKTGAISKYYSRYEAGSLGMVNGELTLTENIADLGAMQCITAVIGENNTNEIRQCYTNFAVCWRLKARKNYYQRADLPIYIHRIRSVWMVF
jgi:putative endopeptidase